MDMVQSVVVIKDILSRSSFAGISVPSLILTKIATRSADIAGCMQMKGNEAFDFIKKKVVKHGQPTAPAIQFASS